MREGTVYGTSVLETFSEDVEVFAENANAVARCELDSCSNDKTHCFSRPYALSHAMLWWSLCKSFRMPEIATP